MFNNKNRIPKSQIPRPSHYVEHYYHKLPKTSRQWNQGYINVVSIDPARKNLAFRIERWHTNNVITPIVFTKIDLEENEDVSMYVALLNFLNTHKKYLLQTHIMVIEKQLHINYQAVRISQHIITYFMTISQDSELLPSIFELDSKVKGQYLGAPKNISEKQLKQWAVTKAVEILTARGDKWSLEVIENTKKKDDLSDVVIQVEALFGYIGVAIITEQKEAPILNLTANKTEDPLLADPVKPKLNVAPQLNLSPKLNLSPTPKLKLIN